MKKSFIKDATKILQRESEKKQQEQNLILSDEEFERKKEELAEQMLDSYIQENDKKRLTIGSALLEDNLQFVNRKNQPLHMMPMLEPDPDLLVMPLYRSTTNPRVDIEVQEFSHEEMKPLEETN